MNWYSPTLLHFLGVHLRCCVEIYSLLVVSSEVALLLLDIHHTHIFVDTSKVVQEHSLAFDFIWSHLSIPMLGISLSFSYISFLSHLSWLLDTMLTKHFIICFLFNFLSLRWNLEFLSDHSNTFTSIKSSVGDLGLERESL